MALVRDCNYTGKETYGCTNGGKYLDYVSECVDRVSSVCIATLYGWTVPESNPGEGEIFRTRTDRPWLPSTFLYNGYWVPFSVVKRPGRGFNNTRLTSAEVKEKVEL
jgi:hypothetical protein